MRLREKIKELEKYLAEYSTIRPTSLESFRNDLKEKAAGERYFEKIVECATDIAFLIIRERKLEVPDDDKAAFDILEKHKVIPLGTAEAMKRAKAMRNFIARQYGKTDDALVYKALSRELPRDMRKFLKEIKESTA